ncbi:MAG: HEAT repeat domain-containing protein [Anaerolineales bacterium]|jgi:hypothetical protein
MKVQTLLVAVILLALGLGACSATPTETLVVATKTPTPAASPTQQPTPVPTTTQALVRPLIQPVMEDVIEQFRVELLPLRQSLLEAQDAPLDFELPPELSVGIFPMDERLYYLQTLLFPETTGIEALEGANAYVFYSYGRGEDLGYTTFFITPITQTVFVVLKLVVQMDGNYVVVESLSETGGEGATSNIDLVQRAVGSLGSLGADGGAIEKQLECILGFATAGASESLCNMLTVDLTTQIALLKFGLSSWNWADVDPAVVSLGDLGQNAWSVIPDLIQLMNHPMGSHTKSLTADALQEITGEDWGEDPENWQDWWQTQGGGVIGWMEGLSDPDPTVRLASAEALMAMAEDSNQAIPALIESLSDPHPSVQHAAIDALAEMGSSGEQVVSGLIEILQYEPNSVLRQAAADALRAICSSDDPLAIPVIIEATKDPVIDVQIAALYALSIYSGNEDVVSALIEAMEAPETWVRQAAVRVLAHIQGDPERIVPVLIEALSDEDYGVRVAAHMALQDLTGEQFGSDPAEWEAWWQER